MKDSAGTGDGAEPALNKSGPDVKRRVLPRRVRLGASQWTLKSLP